MTSSFWRLSPRFALYLGPQLLLALAYALTTGTGKHLVLQGASAVLALDAAGVGWLILVVGCGGLSALLDVQYGMVKIKSQPNAYSVDQVDSLVQRMNRLKTAWAKVLGAVLGLGVLTVGAALVYVQAKTSVLLVYWSSDVKLSLPLFGGVVACLVVEALRGDLAEEVARLRSCYNQG